MVFITISVLVGICNSIGFFFKPIAEEFGWNRAQTAGAYSIGMLVQSTCSPLFGSLGERWSLRWTITFVYLVPHATDQGFTPEKSALVFLAIGLVRPTASALLADPFAGPGFGRLNGLTLMCFALWRALGGYLTGYLFDSQNSYRIAFLLMAAILLAGSAAAVPLGRMAQVCSGH